MKARRLSPLSLPLSLLNRAEPTRSRAFGRITVAACHHGLAFGPLRRASIVSLVVAALHAINLAVHGPLHV